MPLTALVPLELRQVQLGANGLLSPLHVRPRALDLAKLPGANHLRRKHTIIHYRPKVHRMLPKKHTEIEQGGQRQTSGVKAIIDL